MVGLIKKHLFLIFIWIVAAIGVLLIMMDCAYRSGIDDRETWLEEQNLVKLKEHDGFPRP